MSRLMSLLSSAVGTKLLLGLTGLALAGFLIGHLAGNLLALFGPDRFNAYAQALISNPLLVPAELGLLAILAVHVYKGVRVVFGGRAARPVPYQVKRWAGHTSRKSLASATMIVSGLAILAFLPLHLWTFKYGPHYDSAVAGVRDLHRLVVEVFSDPAYVAFYVASMAIVALHLRHGLASALQSLGVDHPRYTPGLLNAGRILAIGIGGGFALIPLWIFLFGGRS